MNESGVVAIPARARDWEAPNGLARRHLEVREGDAEGAAELRGRACNYNRAPARVGACHCQSLPFGEFHNGRNVVGMGAVLLSKLIRAQPLPHLRRRPGKVIEIRQWRPVFAPPKQYGHGEVLVIIHLPDELGLA